MEYLVCTYFREPCMDGRGNLWKVNEVSSLEVAPHLAQLTFPLPTIVNNKIKASVSR